MKATLDFDLGNPDDFQALVRALSADEALAVIHEVDNRLRAWLKHGGGPDTPEGVMDAVREIIRDESLDRRLPDF